MQGRDVAVVFISLHFPYYYSGGIGCKVGC